VTNTIKRGCSFSAASFFMRKCLVLIASLRSGFVGKRGIFINEISAQRAHLTGKQNTQHQLPGSLTASAKHTENCADHK